MVSGLYPQKVFLYNQKLNFLCCLLKILESQNFRAKKSERVSFPTDVDTKNSRDQVRSRAIFTPETEGTWESLMSSCLSQNTSLHQKGNWEQTPIYASQSSVLASPHICQGYTPCPHCSWGM